MMAGALLVALLASCGGSSDDDGVASSSGGSTATGSNVAAVIVDQGPSNGSVNTLFTSVTVCVPGSTTNCQTIDHIQVDTQSYGLRILGSVLTVSLPIETVAGGSASYAECTSFVDGYSWGPVALADVQIAGESAGSVPVQVIGDSSFSTVPEDCSNTGTSEDTVATFGANGILGIGAFAQDCGSTCAGQAIQAAYYSCSSSTTCTEVATPLSAQVQNPVPLFTKDNTGVIIDLPSVASTGAQTISGSLIFGIDTESNNASGSQTVLTTDDAGDFTMMFNGATLADSFIDSGTNGIYFNNSNLPTCTESGLTDFYCPSSTESFNVELQGENGITASVAFSIGNADTLLSANPSFTVFPTLGGTFPMTTETFDFGLPFYYGRRVATAIQGASTLVGTGPYFAF